MSQPPTPPEPPPYGAPQEPSPYGGPPPQDAPPYGAPPYGAPPYGAQGYPAAGYGPPAPPTGAYPMPPKKPRPSAWWFMLPTILLIGAVASVAIFGVMAFRSFKFDGPVPVDGQAHTVALDNTEAHVLWAASPRPTCVVTDTASGRELPLSATEGTFTRSTNNRPNDVAWLEFTPTSQRVDVTCTGGDGTDVIVGARPNVGQLVGGILGAVLLPLGLGFLALVSLIVLIVLFAVRGPRNRMA